MNLIPEIHFDKVLRWTLAIFLALAAGSPVFPHAAKGEEAPVILALGDSLTAGFGVLEAESYPARLQTILRENGYPHKVVNAGVSGDTTAGGLRRLSWLLRHNPRIVILCLGANDGLRGLPVEEMYSNLKRILEKCREKKIIVLLAGMKITPNLGPEYTEKFENVYTRLAQEFGHPLIPFLLEGVAGEKELTRDDGIHPTGAGYEIITNTVWASLQPLLKKDD